MEHEYCNYVTASAQQYDATVSVFRFKRACSLLLCSVVVYWGTGGGAMQRSLSTGVQFAVAIRYTLAHCSKLKQSVDLRSYVESAFIVWLSALNDIEWPDLLTSASKERGCLKVTP